MLHHLPKQQIKRSLNVMRHIVKTQFTLSLSRVVILATQKLIRCRCKMPSRYYRTLPKCNAAYSTGNTIYSLLVKNSNPSNLEVNQMQIMQDAFQVLQNKPYSAVQKFVSTKRTVQYANIPCETCPQQCCLEVHSTAGICIEY